LATRGEIERLSLPNSSTRESSAAVVCVDIPALPPEEQFRLEGAFPAISGQPSLRVERRAGGGLEIGQSQTYLRQLSLVDGRLQTLELDSESSGVRILNRTGESASKTNIQVRPGVARLSSVVTDTVAGPVKWSLDVSPDL